MSWAAGWALVGLVTLPVVWVLHRRRNRPRTLALPSLLFLQPEPAAAPARRQVLDPELWLSFLAVILLVGAAAGPFVTTRGAGRTVRVVVSSGAPAAAQGYRDRVDRVVARIEAGLADADRLLVLEEPRGATPLDPRPQPDTLLGTAHEAEAAWRAVLTDAAAPVDTAGVTWISVGSPDAFNVGIVATSLTPGSAGFELFVGVRGDDVRSSTVRLVVRDRETVIAAHRLDLEAGAHASHAFAIGRVGLAFRVELTAPDGGAWSDDLGVDDAVDYVRAPVRLHLDPALPLPLRRAVEDGLVATLGRRGYQDTTSDPDLLVASADTAGDLPDAPWRLVLHPAMARGALRVRAGTGSDRLRPDRLVRDLSTSGVDLVYAPAAAESPRGGFQTVLGRDVDGRIWPVVVRRDQVVHFRPDPTRGRPAPAETPLWPLFLDDLLEVVAGQGEAGGAGYRRRGTLDDASSALGRLSSSWSPPDLAGFPPDVAERTRSFRPFLVAGALLALLLLWVVRWSNGQPRRPARRHTVPSAHGDPVPS